MGEGERSGNLGVWGSFAAPNTQISASYPPFSSRFWGEKGGQGGMRGVTCPPPLLNGEGVGGGIVLMLIKTTLVLTGTRVKMTSRYHPGSRLWRAPRYSDRQTISLRTASPGERRAFPSLLLAETLAGLHVQIAAPEGFSACCVALARTGSRFAVSLTQAYSFPSSPLIIQFHKIMPQITDAVNSLDKMVLLSHTCPLNHFINNIYKFERFLFAG